MLNVEGSLAAMIATKASDEDIVNIVDTGHIHVGNWVDTVVSFPQLLLNLGRKSLSQRL
jgi:hypothetical protein